MNVTEKIQSERIGSMRRYDLLLSREDLTDKVTFKLKLKESEGSRRKMPERNIF